MPIMKYYTKMILPSIFCFLLMLSSSSGQFNKYTEDFNTLANLGDKVCWEFDCDPGYSITIGSEKYLSMGMIWSGDLGKLCLVENLKTGENKTLKIISPEQHIRLGAEEAQYMLELQDVEQVVKIDTWYSIRKCGLIVMEYVNNTKMPQDLRHVWKQMLNAFAAIHEKGILHLNIQEDNILWDSDGNIKVIDFGFAARLNTINFTRVCGNPSRPTGIYSYSSPEYHKKCDIDVDSYSWARKSADLKKELKRWEGLIDEATDSLKDYNWQYQVGTASDVWSMCYMLYKMMYGEGPFAHLLKQGSGFANSKAVPIEDKFRQLVYSKKSFLFRFYDKDDFLRETVKECLVRDPAERPTIKELLEKLENAEPPKSIAKPKPNDRKNKDM